MRNIRLLVALIASSGMACAMGSQSHTNDFAEHNPLPVHLICDAAKQARKAQERKPTGENLQELTSLKAELKTAILKLFAIDRQLFELSCQAAEYTYRQDSIARERTKIEKERSLILLKISMLANYLKIAAALC